MSTEPDLTPEEVAAIFKRPREYVMAKARAKAWPHYREGKRTWFTSEDVKQIKALGKVDPVGPTETPGSAWGRKPGRRTA